MFNFLNEKFQKVSVLKKQIFVTLILTLICLGIRLSLDIIVSGLSFMGVVNDLFAPFIAFIVTFILCIFTSDKYAKYIFVFGTSLVFYQAARSIPDLSAPLILLLNLVLVTIVTDVKVVILQGIITIVGQIFLVIVDIPGSFTISLYKKLMITGVTAFISIVVYMAIRALCNNMEKVKDEQHKTKEYLQQSHATIQQLHLISDEIKQLTGNLSQEVRLTNETTTRISNRVLESNDTLSLNIADMSSCSASLQEAYTELTILLNSIEGIADKQGDSNSVIDSTKNEILGMFTIVQKAVDIVGGASKSIDALLEQIPSVNRIISGIRDTSEQTKL